ncbi:uncharacterized protein JCM15063_003047 [Sporobolomyces koalae]|uniref:uncharacterized protein n=1 Tax=Sporobolomyces koalae TaxID=500713 RepID=UPI00316B41CF
MSSSEEDELTLEEHEARQRRAEAIPLESGTELAWTGSSLEPGSHPPPDYPHSRSISPSPLRPLESRLLDPNLGVAAQPWRLELVEMLRGGKWAYSQIWRAVAIPRDENARIPVVLKLYQESLYFHRQQGTFASILGLQTAERIRQAESYVYSVARDLQGSDIPLCYGFYTFQQPSGEVSVGAVLEDLQYKRKGIPLPKYLERELKLDSLTFEDFDGIARLGFSETRPKPENDEMDEADEADEEEERVIRNGTTGHPWRNERDQLHLVGSATRIFDRFDDVFDDLGRRWYKFEKERKRLDFLSMHYNVPRAQQRQSKRNEVPREDQLKLNAMLKGMFERHGAGQ